MSESKLKSSSQHRCKLKPHHRLAEATLAIPIATTTTTTPTTNIPNQNNTNNTSNEICETSPSMTKHRNRRSQSTAALQPQHVNTVASMLAMKSYGDLLASSTTHGNSETRYIIEGDSSRNCNNNNNNNNQNKATTSSQVVMSNNSPNYSITNEDIEAFNRVNETDLFIDNSQWLSEKPISVLNLPPADRAVLKIADQRDKIQKKTFTKWINKHLKKVSIQIVELFEDLRDGVNLILLLEILTNKTLKKEKGLLRFHAIQNVQSCLNFLIDHNIKIVNIRPDEIVDGNPKLTLGLIWIIILQFQISDINLNANLLASARTTTTTNVYSNSSSSEASAKDTLMSWVNQVLDCYAGLEIRDFSHSWKNGKAFLAILHRYIPEKLNLEEIAKNDNKRNLQLAFDLAESEFNVCKLLDPEDVDVSQPDEKSVITYVSSLYNAMPKHNNTGPMPPPSFGYAYQHPFNVASGISSSGGVGGGKEKKGLVQEYSLIYKSLTRWLNDSLKSIDPQCAAPLPADYIDLKSLMADLKAFRLEEYPMRLKDRKKLSYIYSELQNIYPKHLFAQSSIVDPTENMKILECLWDKLDAALHNRESQLEQAIFKFERMQKAFEKLNREAKNLNENLNILKEQLHICLSKMKSSTSSVKGSNNAVMHSTPMLFHTGEFRKTIDTISSQIRQNEQALRQHLIDAQKLKEDNYPNSESLIQKLSKLERSTIELLVLLNSSVSLNNSNTNVSSIATPISATSNNNNNNEYLEEDEASSSLFRTPSGTSEGRRNRKTNSRRGGSKKHAHFHSPPPPQSTTTASSFTPSTSSFDLLTPPKSSVTSGCCSGATAATNNSNSITSSISVDCCSSGISSLHQSTSAGLNNTQNNNNNNEHSLFNLGRNPAGSRYQHQSVCITTTTTTTTTTAAAATTTQSVQHHPLSSTSTFASTSSPSSILSSFSSSAVLPITNNPTIPNTRHSSFMSSISNSSHNHNHHHHPSSSFSSSSSINKQLCERISDAHRWINARQNVINSVQFKADIAINEVEMSKLRQIAAEAKKFHTSLEQIELLKLEQQQQNQNLDLNELNIRVNDLFASFNNLCKSLNSAQSHLDSLIEFNKLIQDELRYISEMEDIELNRDWSQPRKLKSSDLIQHKMTVEMTLSHKKPKLNTIINFAERLIEARHPASDDLQGYISTLNSETIWLQQLMYLLGIHISELQQFEKFDKEAQEMSTYLNEVQEQLDNLASTSMNIANWPKSKCEEFTKQFGVFKHNFQVPSNPSQQIQRLYEAVHKLPSYKMRKASLKSPYDKTELLTDYYLVECKFGKGEVCRIVDNSNQGKWKVLSIEKNRDAFIPSVCFSIHGPDPDLIDQVDKIRLKYDQISDSVDRFDLYLRKENVCQIMRSLVRESQSSKFASTVNRESVETLVKNIRDEVNTISAAAATTTTTNNAKRSSEVDSTGSNLLDEFNQFETNFTSRVLGSSTNPPPPQTIIRLGDHNQILSASGCELSTPETRLVDSLEHKLRVLYEKFVFVANYSPPLVTIKQFSNQRNVYVKRNFDIEVLLKQFDQEDCRVFDRDFKEAEKRLTNVRVAANDECRDRLDSIRNKYRNLVNMSNLFSRSFSNIDNLTSQFDEFTSVLCNIEEQLESQAIVDITSTSHLREEIETIGNLKPLIKGHEHDLERLKSTYTELKQMIERVRGCKYTDGDAQTNSSGLVVPFNGSHHNDLQQPGEDFVKLDHLIDQLTDRWTAAVSLYTQRRANLKKCLQSYHDYMSSLKNEKDSLNTISSEIITNANGNSNHQNGGSFVDEFTPEQTSTMRLRKTLGEKKSAIDACNRDAAAYVRTLKALNEDLNSYKQYLRAVDRSNNESLTFAPIINYIIEQQQQQDDNINNNDDDNENNNNNTRLINHQTQLSIIETANQLNELNKQYFDLCSLVRSFDQQPKDDNKNDDTLSEQSMVDFLMIYYDQIDKCRPENRIDLGLNETNMTMNYKDFCGSQELSRLVGESSTPTVTTNGGSNSNGLVRSKSAHVKDDLNNPHYSKSNSTDQFFLNSSPPHGSSSSPHSSSSSSSLLLNNNNYDNYPAVPSNHHPTTTTTTTKQPLLSFYSSSLISDYRLTLTDLIELNLIDISSGMIINPLNGSRLSIADAIRIDLLNSDVKEIANTTVLFIDSNLHQHQRSSLKLSVREAIQMSILNPSRNEIVLAVSSGQNPIKLNLYEARKRNLILKPLTLSEAFIRNLIQPNGFVRNPINNKYYAFETVTVSNDVTCLFDLDSKHIIDPSDESDRRLLSLSEAIDAQLILPRTFELNVRHKNFTVNLYEAFFGRTSQLRLSLLLYKPEIENVYVRMMLPSSESARKRIAITLSRRDKIGLAEAINLKCIDVKRRTYTCEDVTVSLAEACHNLKLIDPQLIDLLDTPITTIAATNNSSCSSSMTILTAIQDSTLLIEKHQFKHPVSNEYMNLESHTCRMLLGDETVKRIKRVITRINVKSYIICLNNSSLSQSSSLIGVNNNTNGINNSISSETTSKTTNGKKQPDLITSCYYFGDDTSSCTSTTQTCSNSSPVSTALDKLKKQQSSRTSPSAVRETKSYVLEYVIEPSTPFRRLTIVEAKKRGLLNVEKGLYMNPVTNTVMTIEEAIELGLIGTRLADRRLILDANNSEMSKMPTITTSNGWQPRTTPGTKRSHESTTLTIESVLDPKTNLFHTVSDAVKMGLIDQASFCYRNTLTGAELSLNDAFVSGFVKGQVFRNQNRGAEVATKILNEIILGNKNTPVPKPSELDTSNVILGGGGGGGLGVPNKSDCIYTQTNDGKLASLHEWEETSVQIKSIFDPSTQTFLTLDEAIEKKLFDKSTGVYTDPLTGREMNLNELALNGYLKTSARMGPDKSVLVIDIKKEQPDAIRTYRMNTETKTTIEDVLYELKELEQLTQQELENGLRSNNEAPEMRRLRNKPIGVKPQIIERRIPSLYGSDACGSETLVIDDVRQSAMLDIDSEAHVLKNECQVEDDNNNNNNGSVQRVDLISLQKKNNNRTVILVEDKLIKSTTSERNEPLKIDVRNKKASNYVVQQQQPAQTEFSSSEFLTRSERAQFERVDTAVNGVKKHDYLENNDEETRSDTLSSSTTTEIDSDKSTNKLDSDCQQQQQQQRDHESRYLLDELNGVYSKLSDLELMLARQLPLSDQLQTLLAQQREFTEASHSIGQVEPLFNEVLNKTRLFVAEPSNRALKLVDDLDRFEKQCTNKLNMMCEQLEIRRRKFDSAVENLEKFCQEVSKYDDQMTRINTSLIDLESNALRNVDQLSVLESCESELKALEDALLTRLLDLKYIKTSQQIYSNLCDLFSKDLQTYACKLSNQHSKRLSADYLSDLSNLRQDVQLAEQRFNELTTKKDQLKAMLREMSRRQREVDSVAIGLESWLDEIEAKLERIQTRATTSPPIQKSSSNRSLDLVRELEELSDAFKLIRADVQQQRRSVDEFEKYGESMGGESAYSRRAQTVRTRFQLVEKLVAEKLDSLIEQLTAARNLKENFDLTNSWLNEIDQTYFNGRQQRENGEIDQIKTELSVRREALVKNMSSQQGGVVALSDSSKIADQVLAKIDAISRKIDQRAAKTKSLNSLLDQFNTHFEKLSLHCKRIAFKIDHINVGSGQLADTSSGQSRSKISSSSSSSPTSESFERSLALIDEMRSDLRANEANILDKVLKPCLEQLESQYVMGSGGEQQLLSTEKFEQLSGDLSELKSEIDQLDGACEQKWALLNECMKNFLDYSDRRGMFDAWLNGFEIKINHFEPVAINLEIVEKQFEQLQAAIDDYEKKSKDLDDFNKSMLVYINSIGKYQSQEPLSSKLKRATTKRQQSQQQQQQQRQNLKSTSSENMDSSSSSSNGLSTIDPSEIEVEFRRLADLYEWLGARLNERKTELTNSLGQMKSYLTDLHALDNRLSTLETDLNVHFTSPNKLFPLARDSLESVNTELKRIDSDLVRLGTDLETIRVKGRQIMLDESKSGASEVKRQLGSLNDRLAKLNGQNDLVKNKMEKFVSAVGGFEASYAQLEASLNEKRGEIDSMEKSISSIEMTEPKQVESQITRLDSMLSKSDEKLLGEVNQNGELLFALGRADQDHERLKSQLTKINTDFNLMGNKINSLRDHKHSAVTTRKQFDAHCRRFDELLGKIDAELGQLGREHPSSVTQSDLNSLESDQLPELGRELVSAESSLGQLVDSARGYLVLNGLGDLKTTGDDELTRRVSQMRADVGRVEARVESVKSQVNQQRTVDQLHAALTHFIELKLAQLDQTSSGISTIMSKLESQRREHDKFIGDLIERGDDVKKLMEFFAEQEEVERGAALESRWNQLCARSDARKEKLFVCSSMSEQFERVHDEAKKYLSEFEADNDRDNETIESRVDRLRASLDELSRVEASEMMMPRLVKIGNEMKQACTSDIDAVDTRVSDVCNRFASVRGKLQAKLDAYNEYLEKERAFTASVEGVKNELNELEARLEASSSSSSSDLELVGSLTDPDEMRRRAELRQKLELCKQLIENEKSTLIGAGGSDETKTKTLNELKGLFDRLESLIEKKQQEQIAKQNEEFDNFKKELGNLDEKLRQIQEQIMKGNQQNGEAESSQPVSRPQVRPVKSALQSVNEQLDSANAHLNKYLTETNAASSNSSNKKNNSEHRLRQLQDTVRDLTEKCSHLNAIQEREDREEKRAFDELCEQMDSCQALIVKSTNEFDQKFSKHQQQQQQQQQSQPLSSSSSVAVHTLISEHRQFERENLEPVKNDLDRLGKQYQACLGNMEPERLTTLEVKYDKLCACFGKFEQRVSDRGKSLELALFKSAKFEDKINILDTNLNEIEQKLTVLESFKVGFRNLDEIASRIEDCETVSGHLAVTSNEIDEFKEMCEKIMETCESAHERAAIEKRMDATVLRWNLLNKRADETRINLAYLSRHLAELNGQYATAVQFLDSLNLKFITELSLNCIDPIVIKHQYERMREINESMVANAHIFRGLRANSTALMAIYESFENRRHSSDAEPVDSDESENDTAGKNRYVGLLPKTISSACVKNLAAMIDSIDVEDKCSRVASTYNGYQEVLRKNLALMERLFPLCESFSSSISQLNQVIARHESELEWLIESSENETSAREKETLYDELKRNVKESEEILTSLEGPLSASIIDEINTSGAQQCDELIADLNENIDRVKLKFGTLNNHLNEYELALESRRLKIKELYGEIDDLLEWLDEVDTRLSQLDSLSHDPDAIRAQLAEQTGLNDEMSKQRDKLKQLVEQSKQLIRQRSIDDSIELKEKLSGLQMQSQALSKQGQTRQSELEQAYAIAKNFADANKLLAGWFDEIAEQLANFGVTPSGAEALKHELNAVKQIERNLSEKKVHLESLNKNGVALAKICNKNTSPQSQLGGYSTSYGGSSSILLSSSTGTSLAADGSKTPGENGSVVAKDCPSARHLKQVMAYANQRFDTFKTLVQERKDELESLVWRAADFPDKLDTLTSSLNANVEIYEYAEPISAHPDKLKSQLDESRQLMKDLEKRKKALEDLKVQVTTNPLEVIQQHEKNGNSQPGSDPITSPENLERKINELDELWHQLKEVSELRSKSLEETLETSETFWGDFNGLMEVIGDLEERLRQIESETVAIDPDSVIEQQHYHEQIVRDIDDNEQSVSGFRETGGKLIELCGQTADQQEVEKTLDELDQAWVRIKKMVRDREVDLQYTFGKACEFQQELIEILEWISLQQEKFVNLDSSFKSNDPTTIRFQIDLLKEFKEQVDPEQVKIQLLNQRFNDLKANTKTNQSFEVLESLQEPLNSANKEWKRLQSSIIERRANLQNALLETGQYNDALDEMLKWLESAASSLDQIESCQPILTAGSQLISSIDIQLARLKVIHSDIKAQEQSVQKLCETGKNLIRNETTGKQSLKELKARVQQLWDSWAQLQSKLAGKQTHLSTRLSENQQFQCELQDTLVWLAEVESSHLNASRPFGGLPETSREQLDKFLVVYKQLDANEALVQRLIETGKSLVEVGPADSNEQQNLVQSLETLASKWLHVKKKSADRKDKLEQAHADACEFHTNLNAFVAWLTETERSLNMLRPVSRVLDSLTVQIGEHQVLQKNITEHREQMHELDRLGTHLKYFSQKQDVILIKNLLISAQNRWEKIVWRSAERTRDLERGYKEAKQFYDTWKELLAWLNTSLAQLGQDQQAQIGNNPAKIKQIIGKHKEFHRTLNQKQPTYDATLKTGRKLIDKCEPDQHDRVQLQEMLTELKNKWQAVCFQSVEKQKRLEDALLCSGQFRDALAGLLEWLGKVEPTLAETTSLNGDLESVLALIEDNQQFQLQLQHKADQVNMVRKAANELINGSAQSDDDLADLNSQLATMNSLWTRIEQLAQERTVRLDGSLKLAKEFNVQARSRLEWLNNAEHQLKHMSSPVTTGAAGAIHVDNQHDIVELIENQQNFVHDLQEQESLMRQCLELGQRLLADCIPEAVINLKHWLVVLQSRWDDVHRLCDERTRVLNEQLQQCKENELALDELLAWLQGAEATLTALEQKPIAQNIEAVEQLLVDHQEFLNDMQSRQTKVEKVTKSAASSHDYAAQEMKKKSTSIKTLNKTTGWKTPEPKIRNPRVKLLYDRWRKVWLMAFERQRKLKEAAERLREMERLKNFNFDEWRRRYMNWHKDNRARITDFFRRQDRDHDGKISREEFIQGILSTNFPSSRLELEAVADIFDLDKDGFIDYKEFLATLKATSSSTQPNVERIRDEVQRQVSLCKCSKRYHVLQISEKHYRFGDSQKLRLVRILQSTVMVRVGGGWMALDEFLVKNDPCRAKGRTNIELRDPYLNAPSSMGIFTTKSASSQQQTSTANNNRLLSNPSASKEFNFAVGSLIPISVRLRKHPISSQVAAGSRTTAGATGLGATAAANTTFTKTSNGASPLDDDSTEMLAHLALNSPHASGAGSNNSHSGSLGASISDLSSEAASEFSDMGAATGPGNGSTAASSVGAAAAGLPPKPNGKKISPNRSNLAAVGAVGGGSGALSSDLPSGASTPTKSSSNNNNNSRLPILKKQHN